MATEIPIATSEILLLEQNPEDIAVIKEAVNHNNISIVPACPDILAFLRREKPFVSAPRPDLIMLDLELSRPEDCEMLTEIKKDRKFRRIPVVVLASSASYDDIFQAYDLHANAYICKPRDRDEYVRVVKAALHFWLTLARLPRD